MAFHPSSTALAVPRMATVIATTAPWTYWQYNGNCATYPHLYCFQQ
jgi:hypothetical protein